MIKKKSDLTFIGFDFWSRACYKDKKGKIYKDITLLGNDSIIPNTLYDTPDNDIEGEPNNPIKFED